MKMSVYFEAVCPKEEVATFTERVAEEYPELSVFALIHQAGKLQTTLIGDIKSTEAQNDIIRMTHHAEGLYYGLKMSSVHVVVNAGKKTYGLD